MLRLALSLLAAAGHSSELSPLVISATRWPESPKRTSRSVSVVDREGLERQASRSAGEAVKEEPGVLVQQTTPGNAAVSVRGLMGKDNLVLVDGVRFNNATTANVQSLSLIDPDSIESIEVLRGPGSVLYGGDALGGVVYVVPRRRRDYSKPAGLGGAVGAGYRTADRGRSARVELEGNRGGFGALVGASYRAFGDLDVGGALSRAVPSSYRARAADAALDLRGEKAVVRATFQHVEQLDVPRYDQYVFARRFGAQGRFEEFLSDPERRDLLVLEAVADELEGRLDSFEAKGWWQRRQEKTLQRRAGTAVRQVFDDAVTTIGGRLEAGSRLGERVRMLYGAEAYRDRVASGKTDVNLSNGTTADDPANANYPDGSTYGSAGLFWLGQLEAAEGLRLETGFRLNYAWVDSVLRSGAAPGSFSDSYRSATGGLGLTYAATRSWQLSAGAWQGFRPPNFNESVALKAAPAGVDAPSPGLAPEKSLGLDLGARFSSGRFSHRLALFHMILSERIERVPGSFNGATVIGGSPVFQRANSGRGYIQGAEWEGRAGLFDRAYLRGSGAWLYGRDTSARVALTRIPPPTAVAAVGRDWTARSAWAEAYVRMAAAQRRLSPADLSDPRIDPAGTAAWATWNVRGGLEVFPGARLVVALENLFDRAYREHASGVEAPGFNAVTTLRVSF